MLTRSLGHTERVWCGTRAHYKNVLVGSPRAKVALMLPEDLSHMGTKVFQSCPF